VIPVYFHAEAEQELDQAALFYESRVPGLGKSLLTEVERTVRLLREYPDAGAPAGARRRRVWLTDSRTLLRTNETKVPSSSSQSDTRSDALPIGASEASALTTSAS
jgi:hypothetical protein